MRQMSLFDGTQPLKITKPIRLIELFAGIGSQAKALERLQAKGKCSFEHYRVCEFDKYAIASYNAVHGTEFEPSDITKWHASDLGIVDTDKYCYLLTYSFPCTDLSVAGKQAGMSKGSGTRSGLLWEVERLLDECDGNLPQILLMENVPQVLSNANMPDFAEWVAKLDSLGYHSEWQVLNATEFGVPQNRKRCFMVSVLDDYFYTFPKGKPLQKRLKDVLEVGVDEKWYLSAKALLYISDQQRLGTWTQIVDKDKTEVAKSAITAQGNQNLTGNFVKDVSHTVRRGGEQALTDIVGTSLSKNGKKIEKIGTSIAHTLTARDYKGFSGQAMTGVMEKWKN